MLMIRAAVPADLDRIAELHARARATYYRARLPEEGDRGGTGPARTREPWARAVARGDGGVLCALRAGELAGVAAFRAVEGAMTLAQLHVDPGHWREGVGRALHDACLDAWRRSGADRVRLEVYVHNHRARSFYAALGWRPGPAPRRPGATHRELWLELSREPPRE
ncbi:GNAT family N-acetyltransferase [Streptomyces sp. NPDC097619]|uniref:GNAT family N-acetyltransferase n=1 Tax=Streptomyces sp. NPDC097619 TaxID=3157228 RepID=UPI00333159CF